MADPKDTPNKKTNKDIREDVPNDLPAMFRPPINRTMRALDRSFFRKTVPLSAATIYKASDIANVRRELMKSKDMLALPRLAAIREVKDAEGEMRRGVLLREGIRVDDTTTWSPKVSELVDAGTVKLRPYDLELDYDYWNYSDIIDAILPEDMHDEIPQGFTQVGHVLHLNLREQYLPYKHLIAEILKDKNKSIRTVINKIEDVGSHSEFRTFPFELLAGDNDTNVTVHEQDCEFRFDYARVYWNSRLETEHRRLVDKFNAGEMVCDVMAGVGPFAVPAGKKKIFVWANDLNPHGAEVMQDAVQRNKVERFVTPFNHDGKKFIPWSAKELLAADPVTVTIQHKQKRQKTTSSEGQQSAAPPPHEESYNRPSIFNHYVMNLPATAIDFLEAFPGVYAGHESLFTSDPAQQTQKTHLLPKVHVYCFSGHSDNEIDDHIDICQRISEKLGYTITPEDRVGGSGDSRIELEIHNVRLVSPKKQMFCASFRLPWEVAFRKTT